MSSEEDVRAADASFSDQLIGNYEPELTDDDEINQAIQASIKTAENEDIKCYDHEENKKNK